MTKRPLLTLALVWLAALPGAACQWLVPLDGLSGGADGGSGPCPADRSQDRNNCGACGHSCLGGECVASRCQPVVIADDQPGPLGITVSARYVLWVNQSPPGIMRWSKDGGGTKPLSSPTDLLQHPFDVAVDASEKLVYWSELDAASIFSKAIDGGEKAMVPFAGPGQAAFLAVEGAQIYVTDYRPMSFRGTIASDQVLYDQMDAIGGLAVKDGIIYWALQDTAKIAAGPVSGSTSGSILVDPVNGRPMGVAVDAESVFWIEDGLRIKQIPKRGGSPPATVYEAPQAFGDSDIAVDAQAIYWTEHGLGATGRVRRLAR